MTNWMGFCSDMAAGAVRIIVCLLLIYRLLRTEKPRWKSLVAAAGGAVFIGLLLRAGERSDFCRLFLEPFLITVCAVRFQKADRRMSLFIGIFYEIAVTFWQFLFGAWLGVCFRSPVFLLRETKSGQAAVWLLHFFLVLLAVFLMKKREITGKNAFRFVSAAALAGFLAVITLTEQKRLIIPEDALSMWTILSVVLLMSTLVFHMNRQYEVEKELAKLKTEQAELLERDYTNLNHAYAMNAKLFHDFHNHIGVLRRFLSHGQYEKAVEYLNELEAPVKEMADLVWTGDETADYLINSKAALAAASGIQLRVQAEFPHNTNIRSADLCAVLGNLLDNAIEAARQVRDESGRFVSLTIRRINQMLVIKVENSFVSPVLEENGHLKTSKTEEGLHGWGLKSAQTAVGKYDGILRTSHTGSTFQAVATLFYEGIGRNQEE